ncbi:MAG: hypothetical protein ACYDEX_23940, partial [Mobilitalea sp.]
DDGNLTLYCPKVVVNAPIYEEAVKDISIQINVAEETYSNSTYYEDNNFSKLSSLCCLSAMKNFRELYEIYRGLPRSTNELYHPLVALGKHVGGEYVGVFEEC